MRTEDLNTLLHQLYKSSDDIRGIIDTIYKLMRLIDVTSLDDGLKIALIPTYENAILALNDVYSRHGFNLETCFPCAEPFVFK